MNPRTELLTGINEFDTKALKLDTELRLNNLFSSIPNIQQPADITQPRVPFGQFGMVEQGVNVNIQDQDYSKLTDDQLKNHFTKSYVKAKDKYINFSSDIFVSQEDTKRYIDEKWGYRIDSDNEDFYASTQSVPAEIGKAVFLKLPSLIFAKLGQGTGFLAGLANPANWFEDNYIASASDNWFARQFETLEDNLKNDWLPTYQEASDRDKGFFSRAFTDLNFWTEDFVDGSAFLASAFVPGFAISKLNLGAKLASAAGATRAAESSSKFLSSMGKSLLNQGGNKLLTTVVNTASESLFEARELKQRIYDDLIASGQYTDKQAQNIAGTKARDSFLMNAAALTFSNFWETSLFYKSMGKSATKEATQRLSATPLSQPYTLGEKGKLGKFLNSSFGYYGSKAAQGVGVEGFYEENIQLAIERLNSGDHENNLFSQYLNQTLDALKGEDIEASTNIGMGGLIGGIFGTVVSKFNKDYSKEVGQREALVKILNDSRNDWLKVTDMYTKAPDGKWEIDLQKLASVNFNQFKSANQLSQADDLKNPYLRNLYRKDAFASFVAAHLHNGTFDNLLNQLTHTNQYTPDQLVTLGFDPNQNSTNQIEEFRLYAQKLKNVSDTLNRIPIETFKDGIRKELLFEAASRKIALEDESTNVNSKISQLSAALGNNSLSDSLVETLNKLLLKKLGYQNGKTKENETLYDKIIQGLDKQISNLQKENEDTLKNLKQDKDGFYKFENLDRHKSPFFSEYIETLNTSASLSNAIDLTQEHFDNVNNKEEYVDDLLKKQQDAAEKAKEKVVKENPPAPQPVTDPQPQPVEKEKPQDTPPPPEIQTKNLDNTPDLSLEELEKLIPLTDYIDKTLYDKIYNATNKAHKNGKISSDDAGRIIDFIQAKEIVGTLVDSKDDMVKEVALKLFRKEPLNTTQKTIYNLNTEEVKAELTKIRSLYDKGETLDDVLDESSITLTSSEVAEADIQNPTETQAQPSGEYDYNSTEVEDLQLDEQLSLLAYQSSLKTVTQEEDESTGMIIPDSYRQFKQKFLRRLMGHEGLFLGNYSAIITKDRPEYPRDQLAQNYLDKGGELGSVLVITSKEGQTLYFDEDYNSYTENPNGDYKILVYSFTKDYWNDSLEQRLTLGAERLGMDIEDLRAQYAKEDEFLKLARSLNNNGFNARVDLNFIIPGAMKKGPSFVELGTVLRDINFKFEIVSGIKTQYVLVDNRYLVNGGLYAVVEQEGEPSFYVRSIPKRIEETPELFEELKGLVNHKYDSLEEAETAYGYLKDILFLTHRRRYDLLIKEEDGKFTFSFSNKGQFNNKQDGLLELLQASRFNVNRTSTDTGTFIRYFIENDKLRSKSVDYTKFLLDNTTTTQRPILEDGKPVFRNVNTYVVFSPAESNQKLIDMLQKYVPVTKAIAKADPENSTDNSTLVSNKVKSRKKLGELTDDAKLIESLKNIDQDLENQRNDMFNAPDEPLQARKTSERGDPITEQEINKVNEMFGNDKLVQISDIANSQSWGTWTTAGITLFKNAPVGTGYHEAWHHFSQLYLTKVKKRALYDEVRSRALKFTSRTGRKLNTQSASDYEIEEFMADDFRDYVLSNGTSRLAKRPRRNTIFREILQFLKRFFFGKLDVQKLYEELYTGNLKRYKPSISNTMWGKLNAGIYNSEGVEIFDTVRSSYYGSVLDAFVGQKLLDVRGSIVNMEESPEYAAGIYKVVYNDIYRNYYDRLYQAYEAEQPHNEQLLDELETLLSNWTDVVRYHKTNTKLGYTIDQELPEPLEELVEEFEEPTEDVQAFVEEASEVDFAGKLFDRGGNETNASVTAPQEIRALIRMLPAIDYDNGKFTIKLDHNGFPKLNEYSRTWNNLAYELSGSLLYEDMYERLKDPELQKKVPEASELIKRLPDPKIEARTSDIITMTRFYSAFNRDYIGIFSGTFNSTTNRFFFLEETKRTVDLILRNWNNNFLLINDDSDFVKNGDVIYNEEYDKYSLDNDKQYRFDFKNPKQIEYFTSMLGIKFSPVTLQIPGFRRSLPAFLEALQANINDRHAAGQHFFSPLVDLRADFQEIKGMHSVVTSIGRMEALYSSDTPSMSYQTAEGEMIYALSMRNFLSTTVGGINAAKSYDDLINIPEFAHYAVGNNPYIKHSLFFNSMFDMETGQRRTKRIDGKDQPVKLTLGNYNGFKSVGTKKTTASSNTGLNTRQKIIFDLNSLLTRGAIEIMRTESSASSFFVKAADYGNNSYLPVRIEEFAGGFTSDEFIRKTLNYLKMELYRIKNFENETDVSDNMKQSAKGYHLFRDVLRNRIKGGNSEELKNRLKKEIDSKDIDQVIDENYDDIKKAIIEYFNADLNSMLRQMAAENINSNDLDVELFNRHNNNFKQLLSAFVGNSFILNSEFISVFDGDLAYQSDYGDYFRRSKGDTSTGKTPLVDKVFGNYMRRWEKSTLAGFLGSAHLNDYRSVRSATIEDYNTSSSYHDVGILKKNLKSVNPNLTDEEIDKKLSKYSNIKVGDGQGHITLDFYRQFLISIGNWSNKQEITYQKELAWFRMNYANENPNYTDSQRKADKRFIEDNKNIISYFPPLKIQYNGPIRTKGTFTKVMDKFSVAPLIPSMIKNTRWEQINIDLIKNGIGYTKFTSGTKKYKHDSVKMYREDGSVQLDLTNYKPAVHHLAYLKEQINTRPEIKEESTFGSQIRKLIMVNLFSNGTTSEGISKKHNEYISLLAELINLEKGELLNSLGLESKEGHVTTKDVKRFVQTVQRQAKSRDFNDNIIDYVQYDKDTKNIRYPLEASLNRNQIQDFLMGIIDRSLRKLTINGDQLIQISSAGFEGLDFKYKTQTEDEIRENGTNGLKFYDLEFNEKGTPIRIKPMQVKVSLNGGFENLLNLIHYDGNKVETLDRLNQLLKNKDWVKKHRKHITLIGYRIPTQGLNSIEFMEVAEFLPSHAGSSIILPAEIITKAGSDYDIDKMFVFRPSFDQDGKFIEGKQLDPKMNKQRISNDIISLFHDTLSDANMYEQLITPNNVNLIKPVALDVAVALDRKTKKEVKRDLEEGKSSPYQATQVVRYVNHLRKFESLLSGKRLLSIFATNNTFGQIIQQAGIKMNVKYGSNKSKTVKLFLLSPEERKQVLTDNGTKINISLNKDVTGVFKQEYFSQLINATVDIGADDFIGYVNLTSENAGMVSLLINIGVPFDRILWFINQPILVEYYADLRSKTREKNRKEIQADILTKYGEPGLYDNDSKLRYSVLDSRINAINNNPNLPDSYHFSTAFLKKAANKEAYEDIYSGANINIQRQLDLGQKVVFAHFLALQEQAQGFFELRSVLNYDTTKFSTPIDVVASFERERTMSDPKTGLGLFDKEDIEKGNKNTSIAPFSNKKLIWQMVQNIMPVGYNAEFLKQAGVTLSKVFGKKQIQRISKGMSSEWIEFIIKNFGVRNGIPISRYFQTMLSGKASMAKRLLRFKQQYPELNEEFAILRRMKPFLSTNKYNKLENLEMQRVFENTTADQNRYIAEFRQLINFNSDTYNKDQQLEIQKFGKDLALFAFLQSGFNKSNISFQELVPQEEVASMFSIAIIDYLKQIASDKALNVKFVKNFLGHFKRFNSQFFTSVGGASGQTWRGKDYRISYSIYPEITAKLPKYDEPKAELPKFTIPEPKQISQQIIPATKKPTDRTQEIREIIQSVGAFNKYIKDIKDPVIIEKLLTVYLEYWDGASVYYANKPDDTEITPIDSDTMSKMLEAYDEYGDDILFDDDNNNITIDDVFTAEVELTIENPDTGEETAYDSIVHMYTAYHFDRILLEGEKQAVFEFLKKNGLDKPPRDPGQLDFFAVPNVKGNLPMQPDNIQKIKEGKKTITNRKEKFKSGIYSLSDGTTVQLTYLGQYQVEDDQVLAIGETKGLESYSLNTFAKLEGFTGAKDFTENNKFSANFLNGKEPRYVYSIDIITKECT